MKLESNFLPKVSIIVPCYNQAEFLEEAVQSVIKQTYQNWECIIVNDGSPDNTEEVALDIRKLDHRIKYLWKENGGLSDARNYGIKKSVGEYILPLDCDDKIGEEYIELAMYEFAKDTGVKLVYCKAEFFGAKSGCWELGPYSYEKLLVKNRIFCSAIYKKEDFDKVGGYSLNLKTGLEDWDFWIRVLNYEAKVIMLSSVQFYYRIKEISMVTNMTGNKEIYNALIEQIYKNNKEVYIAYMESKYGFINALRFLDEAYILKQTLFYRVLRKLRKILH